jgi:D-sedoheptulose 7-phosphate isomerase
MQEQISQYISQYIEELVQCLGEISSAELVAAAKVLARALQNQAQVFVAGNGGSAATAAHLALHLQQAGQALGGLQVTCLTDNVPLITAIANDYDYGLIFKSQLEGVLGRGDVLIAISGSGNSTNVMEAARYAIGQGASVIGFLGFGGGKLAELANPKIVFSSRNYGPVEDGHLALSHLLPALLTSLVSSGQKRSTQGVEPRSVAKKG